MAVWQAKRVRPKAQPLWVSTGGSCGDVGKLGVLQACPLIHSDPLLIHQADQERALHLGCLDFCFLFFLHICQ